MSFFNQTVEDGLNLAIYDCRGKKILTVPGRFKTTGLQRVSWDGRINRRGFATEGEYVVVAAVNDKVTCSAYFAL